MFHIETVVPEQSQAVLPELIALLQDAVASGASIGFLPPMSEEEARKYWNAILEDVAQKRRALLIARNAEHIVGTVQLEPATKPNARHRAEVQKLLVLQKQRQRGLGRLLMQAVEATARGLGRTLLVLDTRAGDNAERLYRKLDYIEVGPIPSYVRDEKGTFEATIVFYKLL